MIEPNGDIGAGSASGSSSSSSSSSSSKRSASPPAISALPDVESVHPCTAPTAINVPEDHGRAAHVEIKHGGEPRKGKERDLGQEEKRETAGEGEGGLDEQEQENQTDAEVASMPLEEAVEEWWELKMVWCGTTYDLRVGGNDMVYDFRNLIHGLTRVPPARQKLIGLSKGKLPPEADPLRFATLGIKKGCKFTMIGTPEELSFKDPKDVFLPEVLDDFDVTYASHPAGISGKKRRALPPADDPRNKRKVTEIVKTRPITVMSEPRPGKRLLVLDLDYTLVDTKPLLAGSLPSEECARPGMHEFLEAVYPHYDIVIWSQTHWSWLETKLVELGVIGGPRNYKVCFVADRTTMFPIFSQKNGQPYKHEVKPLAYFWSSFPHWSPKNTIHIDDLSRNFALNPGEGLKIRAFNAAGTFEGMQDSELAKLSQYVVADHAGQLLHLAANVEDFTEADHTRWKHVLQALQPPQ
ncbi:hypothetical protein EHS25_010308 [Saitozyma podzolica]|uniref:FCP1 homology domain-containing protein n=1 Tax=Saitozyma podzolica TaxID=1890683 RepID=A0A427YJ71_9TREE|nr:hypothetical protein EHS25_010308 [Saitozyma podzolica]